MDPRCSFQARQRKTLEDREDSVNHAGISWLPLWRILPQPRRKCHPMGMNSRIRTPGTSQPVRHQRRESWGPGASEIKTESEGWAKPEERVASGLGLFAFRGPPISALCRPNTGHWAPRSPLRAHLWEAWLPCAMAQAGQQAAGAQGTEAWCLGGLREASGKADEPTGI